jgi:hypothetical protein
MPLSRNADATRSQFDFLNRDGQRAALPRCIEQHDEGRTLTVHRTAHAHATTAFG